MSRDLLDRFWSPSWPVQALLKRLRLPAGTRVLEPFAGREMRIATVLREHDLEVITGDLDPEAEADFLWDFPTEVALRKEQLVDKVGPVDWIVTNSPYATKGTTAAACIEACLEICPRVAALLRVGWLEVCQDRETLFKSNPPSHLILLPRVAYSGPSVSKSNGSPYGSAWIIWRPDAPAGLPFISTAGADERDLVPEEMCEFAPPAPIQGDLL